ncbi:MAG: argO [Paenibacillaceae bacterium]|jgi:L-lysine exporter family protein LysE/ArgO|nr:argO [Paenibacillaceae bacterium]
MTFISAVAGGGAMWHGVFLSLGLILPLGVQNVFIFQQGAYQKRLWRVLPAVLTAALCDTLLITLAVTGVSVIVMDHVWLKSLLMGAGTLFLLYMGWITWNSKPRIPGKDGQAGYSARHQIAFAASVSLLNPHAILDTVGVIGTSSLQYAGTDRYVFVLSCIAVSWAWFALLALAGRWAGSLDATGGLLVWLIRLSAVFIWIVAFTLLYSFYPG